MIPGRRTFLKTSGFAVPAITLWPGILVPPARELQADIIIIGGGIGGCAAALAAARSGSRVILTEETDWLGGQLTQQGVPPDEHQWVEKLGVTQTYRTFRQLVRTYYQTHYPLTADARNRTHLNVGSCGVSRLCHEPRVALAVLRAMVAPYISNGRLQLLLHTRPVGASGTGDRVEAIHVLDLQSGYNRTLTGAYFLDATGGWSTAASDWHGIQYWR